MTENVVIKRRGRIYSVSPDRIIFMEKKKRKIRMHTDIGYIEFYGKFADMDNWFDERFLRCHRSYVINMDKIIFIGYKGIYFENQESVYFGRNKCRCAMKIFAEYISKKFREMA